MSFLLQWARNESTSSFYSRPPLLQKGGVYWIWRNHTVERDLSAIWLGNHSLNWEEVEFISEGTGEGDWLSAWWYDYMNIKMWAHLQSLFADTFLQVQIICVFVTAEIERDYWYRAVFITTFAAALLIGGFYLPQRSDCVVLLNSKDSEWLGFSAPISRAGVFHHSAQRFDRAAEDKMAGERSDT